MIVDVLALLTSKGICSRMKGIFYAVDKNVDDPNVIREIKKLKTSTKQVMGYRESDIAKAADNLLTGEPYSSDELIDELVMTRLGSGHG